MVDSMTRTACTSFVGWMEARHSGQRGEVEREDVRQSEQKVWLQGRRERGREKMSRQMAQRRLGSGGVRKRAVGCPILICSCLIARD
jgi:hypothetical protein